jgi:hypothetical protein
MLKQTLLAAAAVILTLSAAEAKRVGDIAIGYELYKTLPNDTADCEREHGGKDGCLKFFERSNRIFKGYQFYIAVDVCHQVREGYLVTYINDAEMRRAKEAVNSIVEQVTSEDQSIDTSTLWTQAIDATAEWAVTRSLCQDIYLADLLNMSPVPAYKVRKPN